MKDSVTNPGMYSTKLTVSGEGQGLSPWEGYGPSPSEVQKPKHAFSRNSLTSPGVYWTEGGVDGMEKDRACLSHGQIIQIQELQNFK